MSLWRRLLCSSLALLLLLFVSSLSGSDARSLISGNAKRSIGAVWGDYAEVAPPLLLPYASGNGFVSPFPSSLSDRWAGYLAEEQFAGALPNKRTPALEGHHFMEPAALGLGEPGRFEWNFNRLR